MPFGARPPARSERSYGTVGGMSLSIYPVTDPASRLGKAFFHFPLALYRDTPAWTPPRARDVRRILQKRYLPRTIFRSDAFVIVEGARVLARFVVVHSTDEREPFAGSDTWLAVPESIDREDVWTALFDRARAWCRENGATRLVGPFDLGGTNRAGLLVEGYEERTAPFHPPYYRSRFESGGCAALYDFVSVSVRLESLDVSGWMRESEHGADVDGRIRVEHPRSHRDLMRLEREVVALLDGAHPGPRGGVRLRLSAVDHAAVTLLRDRHGRLVGCAVPSYDLSPALRRASGYLGLRTAIDLFRERRRTGRRVVDGLSVPPGDGENGDMPLLLAGLLRRLSELEVEEVTIAGLPPAATSSWSDVIGSGGRICARYRVYNCAV